MGAIKDVLLRNIVAALVSGVLVPGVAWLWKRWRGDQGSRIKELRTKIAALNDFIRTAADLGDSPDAEKAREDAIRERAELLATLSRGAAPAARSETAPAEGSVALAVAAHEAAARRPWLQRAFLLYSPSGAMGWMAHFLFFVGVAGGALGIVAGVTDSAEMLAIQLAFWGSIVALGRGLAALSERSVAGIAPSRGRMERWFLLYRPRGAVGTVLHGTFYLLVLTEAAGLVDTIVNPDTDSLSDILLGFGVILFALLMVRWMARAVDRTLKVE